MAQNAEAAEARMYTEMYTTLSFIYHFQILPMSKNCV